MILGGIDTKTLHAGITKGQIVLISKEEDSQDLNNWRPITLLTSIYKIYAKTFQLRLQPMLSDFISPEQTSFLSLRYIFDNIVLTQETLHWAKILSQPSVFFKLDFAKTYDKVSWRFLFLAMSKIGINERFVGWVKLLFGNASAAINFNGNSGKEFKIERGMRQGCSLASYLFLVVGEVFTHLIKKAEAEGRIRGMTLPGGRRQHNIIQYADDSAFMIRGEKKFIDELVRLLKFFSEASGMEINWNKSCAYWYDKYTHKPEWLAGYNW